jgi:hypothetical protein
MRHAEIYNGNGFTLIEALVAGLLSVLVLLTAFALFSMNSRQISGTSVRTQTRLQYQTVINQIGRTVRGAAIIGMSDPDNGNVTNPSESICLFDSGGTFMGGYKRVGTSLKEWKSGSGWVGFKVGNDSVKVASVAGDSAFVISPDKKSVLVRLNIYGVRGPTSDTFFSKRELLRCRN